jgi:hypothetical protein
VLAVRRDRNVLAWEVAHSFPGVPIPDDHARLIRHGLLRYHDKLIVGGEQNLREICGVVANGGRHVQAAHFFAGLRVPQPDRAVPAGRRDALAVGGIRDRPDAILVAQQGVYRPARVSRGLDIGILFRLFLLRLRLLCSLRLTCEHVPVLLDNRIDGVFRRQCAIGHHPSPKTHYGHCQCHRSDFYFGQQHGFQHPFC